MLWLFLLLAVGVGDNGDKTVGLKTFSAVFPSGTVVCPFCGQLTLDNSILVYIGDPDDGFYAHAQCAKDHGEDVEW